MGMRSHNLRAIVDQDLGDPRDFSPIMDDPGDDEDEDEDEEDDVDLDEDEDDEPETDE